jgi:hypothetical protein
VTFKSLKSNLGDHYHHNSHVRSVTYRKASGRIVICCPVVWPPKLVIFKSTESNAARGLV